MQAIVKRSAGEAGVVVADVPTPHAKPGQVRLRVTATGLCGTDVHIVHDEYGYEAPVVMGHEITGVVDEVGDRDDEHLLGQRVAVETYLSTCERCEPCRNGRRNLCATRRSVGSYEDGGFAEHVVIPTVNLHVLPDHVADEAGALLEPLACVTHLLLDPPLVNAGDRVLVTGPGAMGQLAAQVARASGGDVVLSGLTSDAGRLAIAERLGLATSTELPEAEAFDVVIECSGSAGGASTALRAARRAGRFVQVGIFGREVSLPLDLVLYKELTLTSGFASTPESWMRAIRLVEQRKVELEPLITTRVALAQFHDALRSVAAGEGVKTIVVPAR